MGKILIWAGLVLFAASLVYHFFPGVLSWFGPFSTTLYNGIP